MDSLESPMQKSKRIHLNPHSTEKATKRDKDGQELVLIGIAGSCSVVKDW